MPKQIIYGESNYATIVDKNGYFVDKTSYIAKLEQIANPIFLRPRRFGKSYFCSLLRYYYDLNYVDQFDYLFGETWIGQNPTPHHNEYMVISFNFSLVDVGKTVASIESSFKNHCNDLLDGLRVEYASFLGDMPELDQTNPVSDNLVKVLQYIRRHRLPQVYVIIDEYDNFANQLITRNQDVLYDELTNDD
ncbi:MAG: AAA family ATPase, partial [Chloroflexota bacterium]